MTHPAIIHRTSDGREFDDLTRAQEHQALLNKIDVFLDDQQVSDSRRKRLALMLVEWTHRNENTVAPGEVEA